MRAWPGVESAAGESGGAVARCGGREGKERERPGAGERGRRRRRKPRQRLGDRQRCAGAAQGAAAALAVDGHALGMGRTEWSKNTS